MFSYSPLAETAAWYWLAYETGLGLRRAKNLIIDRVLPAGVGLGDILDEESLAWGPLLEATPEEVQLLDDHYEQLDAVAQRLEQWQAAGIGFIRLNEPAYPATLTTHLRPQARPLLLSFMGDPSLAEMPTLFAVAGNAPDSAATAWTADTFLTLASEGVLPLAVARAGPDADLVRSFLKAAAPLMLVIPQGLATYLPPPALAAAVSAGRALLISPFPPDAQAPTSDANPFAVHAATFAQALATALLLVTPPYPAGLIPDQPCFLRPGLPKTIGCQHYYADAEDFFLHVEEVTAAAADHAAWDTPATLEAPSTATTEIPITPSPPPPPTDAEKLIAQLAQLGHVPEAMKARLRQPHPR